MPRRRVLWWAAAGLAAAAVVLGILSLGVGLKAPPRAAGMILISIDTLRPDRVGVYGHRPLGTSTSPFMDGLAASGAVFTNAVSTSAWTLPGHYALFTGLPDELHDMVDDRVPPPDDVVMMAEVFRNNGYATAGFYSGPYLHPFFGFGRGFDVYESCMGFETVYDVAPADLARMPPEAVAREAAQTEDASHAASTSEAVTAAGRRFIEANAGRPFFLFLHYFDVHHDYVPPPPFDARFSPPYSGWVTGRNVMTDPRIHPNMAAEDLDHLKGRYDGEIAWVDENLRRLFHGLDPAFIDETLVIITSDHGEEFFEHGKIGHRKNLYEESLRVPLIMRLPGTIPAGRQVESPACLYDVFPTVAELLALRGAPFVYGKSLRAALEGAASPAESPIHELTVVPRGGAERYQRHSAIRNGALKLISIQERQWSRARPADFAGALVSERNELYDLAADPKELHDLSGSRPDLLRLLLRERDLLWDRLKETYQRQRRLLEPGESEMPADLERRIRAAGY